MSTNNQIDFSYESKTPKHSSQKLWKAHRISIPSTYRNISQRENNDYKKSSTPCNIRSKSRKTREEMNKHFNNLKHLQRRIDDIGSVIII